MSEEGGGVEEGEGGELCEDSRVGKAVALVRAGD